MDIFYSAHFYLLISTGKMIKIQYFLIGVENIEEDNFVNSSAIK